MENPTLEIPSIIAGLIESPTASDQRAVLQRYFSPDASFDHPLCAVLQSSGSRDAGLLPIYQWLRILFTPRIVVDSVAMDTSTSRLYVDASQTLVPNLPLLHWYAPTCRLIVLLFLHRGADGLFYIHRQEDYYEPQVLPGKLLPGLSSAIMLVKLVSGVVCAVLAWVEMLLLGYWKPSVKGIKGGKVVLDAGRK